MAFYSTTAAYIFFLSVFEILPTLVHMLYHKTNSNKLKKQNNCHVFFSSHNEINLGINNMRKSGNYASMWRLNNLLLNEDNRRNQKGNKKFLKQMKMNI